MTLTIMLIIAVLCDLVYIVKDSKDIYESFRKCCLKAFGVFSVVYIAYSAGQALDITWLHEVVECLCLMVEGAEILNDGETTL